MTKQNLIIGGALLLMVAIVIAAVGIGKPVVTHGTLTTAPGDIAGAHLRATYDPIHFKPAIEQASDEQCLACHKEILEDRVRTSSPAGVSAAAAKAWYQRTSTYAGEQETFHRRHLVTPLAKQLMNLKCNTCHEGHDPREEAPGSAADTTPQNDAGFTLRKSVDPERTCLKCHGQEPAREIMGLPGAWSEVKDMFQNDCLTCHAAFRTHRHQVNYLNAAAIEEAAKAGQANKTGGDVCYGCHGGRPWYRIAYPYPRNPWPDMAADTPDWAKGRPTQSEARFTRSVQPDSNLQPKP